MTCPKSFSIDQSGLIVRQTGWLPSSLHDPLIDLRPVDFDVSGCCDSDPDLVAMNRQHLQVDFIADRESLAGFTVEYQHFSALLLLTRKQIASPVRWQQLARAKSVMSFKVAGQY
jgi:hypothetical protein